MTLNNFQRDSIKRAKEKIKTTNVNNDVDIEALFIYVDLLENEANQLIEYIKIRESGCCHP